MTTEKTDLPPLILETSSNDISRQPRLEKKVKSVKASYRKISVPKMTRKISVPKMTEAVLRNIGEETECSRIEENMCKRGDLVYMYKESYLKRS